MLSEGGFLHMIEKVMNDNETMGIIIRASFDKSGITFVTPDDYSQQLAYMHHPKGHVILPHIHNEVRREILYTKETLVIKKGKIRCDFYTDEKKYVKSVVVETGDVLLLVSGGHGFECLEETKMIEIKQGPYAGNDDKVRFEPHRFEEDRE